MAYKYCVKENWGKSFFTHEERKQMCPHKLPESDPDYVEYKHTLQRERRANLEVVFPHAELAVYLE